MSISFLCLEFKEFKHFKIRDDAEYKMNRMATGLAAIKILMSERISS